MEVIVNGEPRTITPMSVQELLASLAIDPRRVAVELNMDILPKGAYAATLLNDGDRLEIVHFVGGG
ncbi:MAG TPA: sulfur carrier protein ThiS [Geobacteraceae bacterium]